MKTIITQVLTGRGVVGIIILLFTLISCSPPEANFVADDTTIEVGDTVNFQDLSTNDPDTWEWIIDPSSAEFILGTGSGSQNPVLRFPQAGSFDITLTAGNSNGTDIESKADYIKVKHNFSPLIMVYSSGLEGNLLGDSPNREVRMYLPPGYFENSSKRYPVVYLLHGFVGDHDSWLEGVLPLLEINIVEILNDLINEDLIEPMIIAAPNSYNRFHGSKYTNSSTSGFWEDFITKDVVSLVDAQFRTLATRESRGIGGISMGGMGALKIAMKHPDLFSVIYSNSGGILDFSTVYLGSRKQAVIDAPQHNPITRTQIFSDAGVSAKIASSQACAPAYAPNPEAPPFYGDFPLTAEGEIIENTWQRWLEHDPLTMLPTYKDNLNRMTGILLDWGNEDEMGQSNAKFQSRLAALGIGHDYEIYQGDHTNRAAERFRSAGFPFFSEHLVHD